MLDRAYVCLKYLSESLMSKSQGHLDSINTISWQLQLALYLHWELRAFRFASQLTILLKCARNYFK